MFHGWTRLTKREKRPGKRKENKSDLILKREEKMSSTISPEPSPWATSQQKFFSAVSPPSPMTAPTPIISSPLTRLRFRPNTFFFLKSEPLLSHFRISLNQNLCYSPDHATKSRSQHCFISLKHSSSNSTLGPFIFTLSFLILWNFVYCTFFCGFGFLFGKINVFYVRFFHCMFFR